MKLTIVLLCIISSLINPKVTTPKIQYYKITNNKEYLYQDTKLTTQLFELPLDYYVQLISSVDDVLYVDYGGVRGYLSVQNVTKVDYIPATKICIRPAQIATDSNITLRSNYNYMLENIICELSPTNSKISVISQIYDKSDNLWYFANIQTPLNNNLKGYIHSSNLIVSSTIPKNDGSSITVLAPTVQIEDTNSKYFNMLAICIAIPIICLVLYALIAPKTTK